VSLLTAPINPSLCPHAARVSLIIDQSRCNYNTELNQIEVVFYPIQVGFADDRAGKYFAAAIILWPLALVFLVGHYVLVAVRSSPPTGASEVDAEVLRDLAMQRYKFPSLTVSAMALFFWQPLVMSAVTVLVHGADPWTRVGAFTTLVFALGFASFVARWYFSRRILIEFVPHRRYYFRRHAFNTLVLRGGDVTKLLGILALPPVEEPPSGDDADSDDESGKAKKDKKNKKKAKDTKKTKAKKKSGSGDDSEGSGTGAADGSDDSGDDGKSDKNKKKKSKGAKALERAAKAAGMNGKGRSGGEDAQPMSLAERAKRGKKGAQNSKKRGGKPDEMDAEAVDIPVVPLSREMKMKVHALLMRDWQEHSADEDATEAERAKLQRGVGLPSLPKKKAKKKSRRGADSSSDEESSSSESASESGGGDKPAKPLPKWMLQAPWPARTASCSSTTTRTGTGSCSSSSSSAPPSAPSKASSRSPRTAAGALRRARSRC